MRCRSVPAILSAVMAVGLSGCAANVGSLQPSGGSATEAPGAPLQQTAGPSSPVAATNYTPGAGIYVKSDAGDEAKAEIDVSDPVPLSAVSDTVADCARQMRLVPERQLAVPIQISVELQSNTPSMMSLTLGQMGPIVILDPNQNCLLPGDSQPVFYSPNASPSQVVELTGWAIAVDSVTPNQPKGDPVALRNTFFTPQLVLSSLTQQTLSGPRACVTTAHAWIEIGSDQCPES